MPASLEKVIDALKLKDLPQEEQDAVLVEFSAHVFRSAIITMFEQMDEPTRDAFNKLASSDASEEDLRAFLDQHVPHSDQIVKETVDRLLGDILAVTNSQ